MSHDVKIQLLRFLRERNFTFVSLDEYGSHLGSDFIREPAKTYEPDEYAYLKDFVAPFFPTERLNGVLNELSDLGYIDTRGSHIFDAPNIRITAKGDEFLSSQKILYKIRKAILPAGQLQGLIWGILTGVAMTILGQLALQYFKIAGTK